MVLHTFSKIFGLAGLRVGWARAPRDVAMILHRVRGVFNVSGPAQAAAIAALADTGHTRKARAHNDQWLPWLTAEIKGLGLTVIPSIGNFLLLKFEDEAQCQSADSFCVARV